MANAMKSAKSSLLVLAGILLPSVIPLGEPNAAPPPKQSSDVDFSRQIQPILAEHCFTCHGPDEKKRKAKLRLDTQEGLFSVVTAGKLDDSELIRRIKSSEADEVMPPKGRGKPLTPDQINLLQRWVEVGAPWSQHWAFVAPRKSNPPDVSDPNWARTPIDRFILSRLDREGLKHSPEADKATLLRRVTFDLTGLPPSTTELDAFLADTSASAYETVVTQLLASPRFGEHMARFWLDAARYGDTHGLHLDNYREIWPYRDWVVRAFNENMPFDRFVIEQLAGDLLPDSTLDQKIATGFVRCNVSTNEGGSIEEECYVRNVVDRVDTFGTVMLGLTNGCSRCHDHKYDPITMRDYYGLFAFFNSLDEKALDGNAAQYAPVTKVGTSEQLAELNRLRSQADVVRREIDAAVAGVKLVEPQMEQAVESPAPSDYVWIDDDTPNHAKVMPRKWNWHSASEGPVASGHRAVQLKADGLDQFYFENAKPGLIIGRGDILFASVYLDPERPPTEIMLQWNSGAWSHRAYWGANQIDWGADGSTQRHPMGPLPKTGEWVRLEVPAKAVGIRPGTEITGWAFTQFGGTARWDKAGILTRVPQGAQTFDSFASWIQRMELVDGAGLAKSLQDAVNARAKRTDKMTALLKRHFIENVHADSRTVFDPLHAKLAKIEQERNRIDKQLPTTLICKELSQPKQSYILKRGEYDQRGEPVARNTPAFLPPMPAEFPKDRLGLARWLVTPEHPLMARVAVNRFWQQVFGTGLVKTAEDFGTQGEPPSHPELLDWLAVDFRENGWDVKALMRQLVLSATYRQTARVTPDRLHKDPANRLLSRGPRYRLDAEMLRDQALAVSGLLIEKMGGPAVKPPQPPGLWEAVGYLTSNTRNFTPDTGPEKIHRRSLYTFWKRTAPPPQMGTFDTPSREACTVRRERTNTPLQALLMMNETQCVEASRAFAERAMKSPRTSTADRLAWMFRAATCRQPDDRELKELSDLHADLLVKYQHRLDEAKKLISIGESKPDAALNPAELAAYTMIANLILNLDEVLTKG